MTTLMADKLLAMKRSFHPYASNVTYAICSIYLASPVLDIAFIIIIIIIITGIFRVAYAATPPRGPLRCLH